MVKFAWQCEKKNEDNLQERNSKEIKNKKEGWHVHLRAVPKTVWLPRVLLKHHWRLWAQNPSRVKAAPVNFGPPSLRAEIKG